MKRSFVLSLLVPLAFAALCRADDKKNSVAVAITTKYKGEALKTQMAQYGVCDTLKGWGFSVQSRVGTAWDEYLKKGGITVVPPADPAKKDQKKPDPTAFTIEGTIEFVPHKVPFYQGSVPVICFIAKVQAVVKDASGNELKKIAWNNLYGDNQDAGEQKVMEESERRATRFLMRDVLSTKEIADQVPQARKDELKKFLTDEDAYWKDNFDAAENHKVPDANEKK